MHCVVWCCDTFLQFPGLVTRVPLPGHVLHCTAQYRTPLQASPVPLSHIPCIGCLISVMDGPWHCLDTEIIMAGSQVSWWARLIHFVLKTTNDVISSTSTFSIIQVRSYITWQKNFYLLYSNTVIRHLCYAFIFVKL